MDKLLYKSMTAMAEAIRQKQVSSYELVAACIARIEAVNPRINAVVQQTFEAALDRARHADIMTVRGEQRGVLHGIPMTIKDSFDTAGMITTAGTKGRATFIPASDATVVARLRRAGAILIGKTNTSELTAVGITDNYVYGRTNNPYDLTRTPAGSSGGAAAIVAAGGIPFDIGSDTGGSIRMPAHYCGIAGIKPTTGRVPRTGHVVSFEIGMLDPLTQIGPLTRYVEDLIALLPIISGVDGHDPAIAPVPLGDPSAVALTTLSAAYYMDNGIMSSTSDTRHVVRQVVDVLAAHKLTLVEDRPPDLDRAGILFGSLLLADSGEAIRRILQTSGTPLQDMHPSIAWTQSDHILATLELTDLIANWMRFQSRMLAFMQGYDVIICPASSSPAITHDTEGGPDFSYTNVFNLTGWPSVVVRAGTSREGLPIGIQIVAHPWREDVALAVGQCIESALGGWQPPPL